MAQEFFSSSPGPLPRATARSTIRTTATTATSAAARISTTTSASSCHDHNNLQRPDQRGQGLPQLAAGEGQEVRVVPPRAQGPRLRHHGLEDRSRAARRSSTTSSPAGSSTASTRTIDCDDCHKTHDKQGLKTFMGTDRLCGSCHLKEQPHKFEASEKDKLACERCHGESVWKPAKPPSEQQFNHDDRKDAIMPLLGIHKDVACSKCHPKSVFNLPFPKARLLRQRGLSRDPARRPSVRQARLRVVPLADVQDAQAAELRSHREDQVRPRSRAPQDQVLRLPHQGARRGEAERRVRDLPREGHRITRTGSRSSASRRAARTCHPSGGPKFVPNAFNHDAEHAVQARVQARRAVHAARCHRGTSPADFEDFRSLVDKNGKTDCMGCHAHKKVHADRRITRKGKYKNTECLKCHMHPGDPTIRTGKDNTMVEDVARPQRHVPAGQGPQGRAVRATATPAATRRARRRSRDLKPNCNANGAVPRGLAAQGHARREVLELPHRAARGTRSSSITTSRSPRTRRARSSSSRSRAST